MKTEPLFPSLLLLAASFVLPVAGEAEGAASLLAVPKVVPRAGQPDVLVGPGRRGPYKGNQIYQRKPSARQRLVLPYRKSTATSYFKVQNDARRTGVMPYSLFVLKGAGSTRSFKVAYFNASNRNITAKVARGRQVLNIAARSETVIRQRISPTRKAPSAKYSAFPLSAKDRRSPRSDSAEVAIRRP